MRFCFLLFLVVLVHGCTKQALNPEQLRAEETALIQATVTDPVRAERLLGLLEERELLITETTAMLQRYRREFKTINADYDAGREKIVEMIDNYNRERAQKQLRFIELMADMKAATTAAEWKAIAEFQLDSFSPRQLVYGRATGGS